MTRTALSLGLLVSILACGLNGTAAQAQPIRTFVALTGADANPCTFASPCKSVQHAHDVVAAGGEIRMLDPGSYGLLTITKAVSILGDGHGGIAASSGATAVTINAGQNDKINLRGVLLEGFNSGGAAVLFNSGAKLTVQDCMIRNFLGVGIFFAPSTPGLTSKLTVSSSVISSTASSGMLIQPSGSASVTGVIDGVQIDNSTSSDGLEVFGNQTSGTIQVVVSRSVIVQNRFSGIVVQSTNGSTKVTVRDSTISSNLSNGLEASAGAATLRVTRSTITGNDTGFLAQSGGTLTSYGDNTLEDNTTNGSPTSTIGFH